MTEKFLLNLGMLVFTAIGSALIGYYAASWALGTGIFFLTLALRPWRES